MTPTVPPPARTRPGPQAVRRRTNAKSEGKIRRFIMNSNGLEFGDATYVESKWEGINITERKIDGCPKLEVRTVYIWALWTLFMTI
jgi:hypothetical protein